MPRFIAGIFQPFPIHGSALKPSEHTAAENSSQSAATFSCSAAFFFATPSAMLFFIAAS